MKQLQHWMHRKQVSAVVHVCLIATVLASFALIFIGQHLANDYCPPPTLSTPMGTYICDPMLSHTTPKVPAIDIWFYNNPTVMSFICLISFIVLVLLLAYDLYQYGQRRRNLRLQFVGLHLIAFLLWPLFFVSLAAFLPNPTFATTTAEHITDYAVGGVGIIVGILSSLALLASMRLDARHHKRGWRLYSLCCLLIAVGLAVFFLLCAIFHAFPWDMAI